MRENKLRIVEPCVVPNRADLQITKKNEVILGRLGIGQTKTTYEYIIP